MSLLGFGLDVANYPYLLLGCIAIWVALGTLTRLSHISAAAFALAGPFFAIWVMTLVAYVVSTWQRAPDPPMLHVVLTGIFVVTAVAFGICVLWAVAERRSAGVTEAEQSRAVKLAGLLLGSHVVHLVLAASITAFAAE
jgi:hypothetical protein